MKKLIFSLLILLLSDIVHAQLITSGKIRFKESFKLDLKVDDDSPVAKLLPQSQNLDKLLFFNSKEAIYTNKGIAEDQNIESNEGNNQIKITFKVPETAYYSNIENQSFIHETFIMDKAFLVSDQTIGYKWQITGEQKLLLGHPCQKAILQDDTREVIVWFSPRIPVSIGPNDLNGLPGIILMAEFPKENRVIIAESIEAYLENFVIEKPISGKRVTKKEFDRIKKEKDEELELSGGKGIKIITHEIKN